MTGAQRQRLRAAIDERRRQIVQDEPRRGVTECDNCGAPLPPLDARGRNSRQRFCGIRCRRSWGDKRRR